MIAANLWEVFIGIESPDENVLETSHKYHNIKNPLLESLDHLKRSGMEVIGSFIIGLDGERSGAGERICAFIRTDGNTRNHARGAAGRAAYQTVAPPGERRAAAMDDDMGTFSQP